MIFVSYQDQMELIHFNLNSQRVQFNNAPKLSHSNIKMLSVQKVIVFKQKKVHCIYFTKCIKLNSNCNQNGKKNNRSNKQNKKLCMCMQHTFLCHYCCTTATEISQLHVLWRKCPMCSQKNSSCVPIHCFSSLLLIFSLLVSSIF